MPVYEGWTNPETGKRELREVKIERDGPTGQTEAFQKVVRGLPGLPEGFLGRPRKPDGAASGKPGMPIPGQSYDDAWEEIVI